MAATEPVQVSTQDVTWETAVAAHRRVVEKFGNPGTAKLKRLRGVYERAIAELSEKVAGIGAEDLTYTQHVHNVALSQLRAGMAALDAQLASNIAQTAGQAQAAGIQTAASLLTHGEARFAGSSFHVPADMMARLIGAVGDETQRSLLRVHATSVKRYGSLLIERMEEDLVHVLATGGTLNAAVRAIRTRAGIEAWRAERIARTEWAGAYNAGSADLITETRRTLLPDLMMRWTELVDDLTGRPMDDRVAGDSLAMHGQAAEPGGGLFVMPPDPRVSAKLHGKQWAFPPNRPNDRSVLEPWRPGWRGAAPAWVWENGARRYLKAEDADGNLSEFPEIPTAPEPGEVEAPKDPEVAPVQPQPPRDPFPTDAFEGTTAESSGVRSRIVVDAEGRRFLRTRFRDAEEEAGAEVAEAFLRTLGARVPRSRTYTQPDGSRVRLSQVPEGAESISDLAARASTDKAAAKRLQKAKKDLAEFLPADAVLGGLNAEGILVDPQGRVHRGAALGVFRRNLGGGERYGDEWGEWPEEVWTFRDRARSPVLAPLFEGSATWKSTSAGIRKLAKTREDLATALEGMPSEVRRVALKRLDNLAEVESDMRPLVRDDHEDAYVDAFAKYTSAVRQRGFLDGLTRLKQVPERVEYYDPKEDRTKSITAHERNPRDADGVPFDGLRGKGGRGDRFYRWLDTELGPSASRLLAGYASAQGGSSWSGPALTFKAWIVSRMRRPKGEVFWNGTTQGEREAMLSGFMDTMARGGDGGWGLGSRANAERVYTEAFAAHHAFHVEILRKTGLNVKGGMVKVYRTEPSSIVHPEDVGVPKVRTRGLAESFSLLKPIRVYGTELTVQDVPLHRVLGTYLTDRPDGGAYAADMYAGDDENEVVVNTENLKSTYLGELKRRW